MGGVDLLDDIQEFYHEHGVVLTPRAAPPLRFSFANGDEDVPASVVGIPDLP